MPEIRVNNIILERQKVFEKQDKDWFFASPFLNFFHSTTNEYIISDELLFKRNDYVDDELLLETERNLRATELFTNVKIEIDSIENDYYDIYVTTKDRWSLYPAPLYGHSDGYASYGGKIEEYNLFGTGTSVLAEALFREEDDVKWQGRLELFQRRLFRSNLSLDFSLLSNRIRTEQAFELSKRYLTLDDRYSFGVKADNQYGKDFLYIKSKHPQLLQNKETKVDLWFSRAWWRKDRVFFTALLEYHKADRGEKEFTRAFDNSGKILFAFSSVAQDFFTIDKVNSYFYEDMVIGGWGSAVLGKIFPIGSKGESLYYVAGQGERSYYKNGFYIFGQLTGASSFTRGESYFTYEEFKGNMFYKILPELLITARLRQQTVWNWFSLRQLVLDTDAGLRGYNLNSLAGENRIISNFELRYFPDLPVWVLNFSGVAFFDIGSVWNQSTKLSKARFHPTTGAGIRVHFSKSDNPSHIFRLDFAYNLHARQFGGIIFTVEQMFPAITNHEFKLPEIYGLEFDYE